MIEMRTAPTPTRPIPQGLARRQVFRWLLAGPLMGGLTFGLGIMLDRQNNRPIMWGLWWTVLISTVVVCIIGSVVHTRRWLHLVQYGAEVIARVKKLGAFTQFGMVSVTIEYELRGRRYKRAFMGNPEHYCLDDEVIIFVDPLRPRRYLERRLVMPAQ